MKQVERSALLPYTTCQMFDVVNDVSAYPLFLPWCAGSEVIAESAGEMTACLTIARAGLHWSITTRNTLQRPRAITMTLVDGPFSSFRGEWRFDALGGEGSESGAASGCKVALDLQFDFDNRLVNLTFGKIFQFAADTMVDAFCGRAHALYDGTPPDTPRPSPPAPPPMPDSDE